MQLMQLITKQELANEAKDHWKMQYFKDGEWYDSSKEMIYNHLVMLGDNPAPSLVDDSGYCYLCKDCLAKALDLF